MKSHPHGLGWIETANGERRWFQAGEETHKAFNQRVQPSLAQYGIDWWLTVEERIRKRLGDRVIEGVGRIGMVMIIHDSMVLLLPNTKVGDDLAMDAADQARFLWDKWFAGVPGGADKKVWR